MSVHTIFDPAIAERLAPEDLALILPPASNGRAFDLHPALFAMTIGCYLGFLLVMGMAFMTGELVIPFAIFVAYIGMGFGVPALWARVSPAKGRPESWAQFLSRGVNTGSGHLTAGAAIAQMMTVPILILLWGVAIVAIRASI